MAKEEAIRIQRKRTKGWKMPANTVYVGRGSRWGNPFRLVQYSDGKWAIKTDGSEKCNSIVIKYCHAVYETKESAAKDAVKCYSHWLLPYKHGNSLDEYLLCQSTLKDAVMNLKGKNLACWCKPDETCHADYLINLVENIK